MTEAIATRVAESPPTRERGEQDTERGRREEALRLVRGADGQLWARRGRGATAVRVARCFPWSRPDRWISLRDGDEEEVALVREPAELDADSRTALEAALVEAGFVLRVVAVVEVEEEIEIRTFRVRTAQGPRSFQTLRDEWPREVPGGGLLFRDVVGDLYLVREPEALDPRSRKLLWPFLD